MAAALLLGYPIVVYLAVTGYVEAELTLFVTAGLYALERWREERQGGWLVLAAVFAGSAAATKYLGLFFVAALTVELALAALPGQRVRTLLRFAALSLLVLAPWYVRILIHTGNPVFPFLPQLFEASAWVFEGPPSPELGERLAELPRLPWDVLFERENVGFQPPFSPAFLLGLPLVVTGAWRDRRLRRLAILALAYVLAALALPPDVRYLAAVLPALSLTLAVELAFRAHRWRGSVPAALCLVFLLPSWAWAGYRFVRQGPLPVTAEQRERYLTQALPVWPALRFLNDTRGGSYTVYAFHAESMSYFADGCFLGDWNGPARYDRLVPHLDDPVALWRELRRLGADHLLVARGTGVHLPVRDPAFRRLFRMVYSDAAAEVYELAPSSSLRNPSSIRPPSIR
jgi:4-amino-4-deoxy-L-arabinose transferase-like glycosyltransferase